MSFSINFEDIECDLKEINDFLQEAEKITDELNKEPTASEEKTKETSRKVLRQSQNTINSPPLKGRLRGTSKRRAKALKTKKKSTDTFSKKEKPLSAKKKSLQGRLTQIQSKIEAKKANLEKKLPKVAEAYSAAGLEVIQGNTQERASLNQLERLFVNMSSCLNRVDELIFSSKGTL